MKKKKKFSGGTLAMMLIGGFAGGILGFMAMAFIDRFISEEASAGQKLFVLAAELIILYLCVLLQIIIHEGGHLLAGLATGYHFSSFRVGSLMIVKENGSLKLKRYSLAGTGGQCLMTPPDMKDGKIPFVFYNLGGALLNLAVSAVFAAAYIFFDSNIFASMFMLSMCVVGLLFALTNGIPIKSDVINNDGSNAVELGKSEDALKSFWTQMKMIERLGKGQRLKDMPKEWFYMPDDEAMKNSLTASMGVLYENLKMDEMDFETARELCDHMISMDGGIVGLHKSLLACDRLYLELIGEQKASVIDELYTKELKKFMKQMKKLPSVIRTAYAYELLYQKDEKKASEQLDAFEKCAKSHPYPVEIDGERELIAIAKMK